MVLSLERETLFDLLVNAIPIAILGLLDVMFLLFNPWGWDLWYAFWMHFLTLFPLAVLALLSYVSGRVIQRDEHQMSGEAGQAPTPANREGSGSRPSEQA